MDPLGIKEEYLTRMSKLSGHPGLYKIIKSAHQKYDIENSYDLDTLITMYFMNQFLPVLNDVENHMDRIHEELSRENQFREPTYEEIARRYMEEVFSDMNSSAKVLTASLFGELDGDPDVEEYVQFRAAEFKKYQVSTRKALEKEKRNRG